MSVRQRIGKDSVTANVQEKAVRRRKAMQEAVSLASVSTRSVGRNDLSPELHIIYREVGELSSAKRRVRKHQTGQVERIARSITQAGICVPIIIDRHSCIINGHLVLEAAKSLGIRKLPCICLDHLTERQVEYLSVALNRLGETGEWDLEQLKPILLDLKLDGFELEDTGFSLEQIDVIMLDETNAEPTLPEPDIEARAVSVRGDHWRLGEHELLCGDALEPGSYEKLLTGQLAAAVLTDCPWNIPIEGNVSGLGKKVHKDFKMAAGEMTSEQFIHFTDTFTALCAGHLMKGGVFYSFIDWRSVAQIVESGLRAGLILINILIWYKGSGGMGGLYRSAHEMIPLFCNGSTPRVNNVQLGKHGRDRRNVWEYPGANRPGSSAAKALAHHPTPKPVEMFVDALLDVTKPGELVLDPFLGSGTTVLAAEKAGRVARGIELDPRYVDVAIRRWQELTGADAVHEETGMTYAETATLRLQQAGEVDEN